MEKKIILSGSAKAIVNIVRENRRREKRGEIAFGIYEEGDMKNELAAQEQKLAEREQAVAVREKELKKLEAELDEREMKVAENEKAILEQKESAEKKNKK